MERNLNTLFLYQTYVTSWMLTFVTMGLVITWTVFFLKESTVKKRPGINIKEF